MVSSEATSSATARAAVVPMSAPGAKVLVLAERRPVAQVPRVAQRPCATCRHAPTCQVARYTDGEVAICSRWEEREEEPPS